MVTIPTTDIKGLIPAVDPRKINQPFILGGSNFKWNVDGPHSAFGARITSFQSFYYPEFVASFRVEDDVFIFTKDGVYSFDNIANVYIPQYIFSSTLNNDSIWSTAFVGGIYFFCHSAAGVIYYNPTEGVWGTLNGNSNLTNFGAKYITDNNGRLIILGTNAYIWSALDDGTDLTPADAGPGLQSTAIIGGTTYVVENISNGFVVYTSRGTIKATFVGGPGVYRHTVLDSSIRIINAFSVVNIDDTRHIVLEPRGFYETDGTAFKLFDPLFSEYLTQQLLKQVPPQNNNYKFVYNPTNQLLLLSVAYLPESDVYDFAYVNYMPVEKWGIFNHQHYGFVEHGIASGPDAGFAFGYINTDKLFMTFDENVYIEQTPDAATAYLYQSFVEFPARIESGIYRMPSTMFISAVDEAAMVDDALASGYYNDPEGTPARLDRDLDPLDSYISVGLFRLREQKDVDELGFVYGVTIGAGILPPDYMEEDWMALDGDEDWNALTDEEDWGVDVVSAQDFDAEIMAYNDGKTIFDSHVLEAFYSPGYQKFYGADITGVYFGIKLSAMETRQSFHLKFLEIAGSLAGVL